MLSDRLRAKIAEDAGTGCWRWTGCVTSTGYGRTWDGKRADWAHRVIYRLSGRPLPEGLVLDHLCRNRRCVNPDHLEPVSDRTNTLRGINPEVTRARHKAKTHCKWGHPLFGANLTRDKRGHRICRTCQAAHAAKHRDANRESLRTKWRENARRAHRRKADVLLELANAPLRCEAAAP